MKYSKQRELIYEAVVQNSVHLTADNVYTLIREENPNVSLGTVYRNLNLLSDNGLLRKIAMPNAPDRFDGRIDEHYHMICRSCGSIFDLEADVLPQMTNNIMRDSGFMVQKAHLVVEGICKECNESICSHFDDN